MKETETILRRYGTLRRIIKECEENLAALNAERLAFLEAGICMPPPDQVRVRGGKRPDPTCRAALIDMERHQARIVRAQEELAAYRDEYDDITRGIRAAGLTEMERRYLELRWGEGLARVEIAVKLGYCERQCGKINERIQHKLRNGAAGLQTGRCLAADA